MALALERNLQEVLQRLDQYSSEEEGLKQALEQISSDMQDKLDGKAADSLKKYLGELSFGARCFFPKILINMMTFDDLR